jgi:hypothetical protein
MTSGNAASNMQYCALLCSRLSAFRLRMHLQCSPFVRSCRSPPLVSEYVNSVCLFVRVFRLGLFAPLFAQAGRAVRALPNACGTARLWLHFFVCGRACVRAKRVLACRSKGLHSARHFRSVVARAWPSARTSFTSLYLPPSPPALLAHPVAAGLCVSVPSVPFHYHPYQRLCRACTSWTLPAPLSRSQRNCQRPAQCGRTHAHMERTHAPMNARRSIANLAAEWSIVLLRALHSFAYIVGHSLRRWCWDALLWAAVTAAKARCWLQGAMAYLNHTGANTSGQGMAASEWASEGVRKGVEGGSEWARLESGSEREGPFIWGLFGCSRVLWALCPKELVQARTGDPCISSSPQATTTTGNSGVFMSVCTIGLLRLHSLMACSIGTCGRLAAGRRGRPCFSGTIRTAGDPHSLSVRKGVPWDTGPEWERAAPPAHPSGHARHATHNMTVRASCRPMAHWQFRGRWQSIGACQLRNVGCSVLVTHAMRTLGTWDTTCHSRAFGWAAAWGGCSFGMLRTQAGGPTRALLSSGGLVRQVGPSPATRKPRAP